MLEGDYRSWSYPHNNYFTTAQVTGTPAACAPGGITGEGCVTVIGGYGQTNVPSFTARDTDFDGRFALKIAEPRIYIGVGYLHREENYGYPKQNGFGFGAEKLPDLDQPFSVYGSVWYYPSIQGDFTFPVGAPASAESERRRRCRPGSSSTRSVERSSLGKTGLFLDAGFLGDTIRNKNIMPSDATHAGGYVGLGIKF